MIQKIILILQYLWIPGTKTDYSFSDGWVKPGVKQYLGKDVNEN